MAENLDKEASYIEKHVIIGEISPYMPVVKEEILNYYDNEFESTPFSVQINREEPLLEECESRHFQPLYSGLTNKDNSENMLLNCNKIILGSKPNRVSIDEENLEQPAKSYQENNEVDEENLEQPAKSYQENNEVSIDENYFEELVTSYEPSVVLHDIQSYLHKSKRFCDCCSTLFPEPNSYENHVQIFHSEKCLTGMSRIESLTERRQHKCTICDKLFVAPHVLRRHLMNIHKLNKANVFENTTKYTSAEVIEETTKKTNGKRIENITKEDNAVLNENTVKKTNANIIKNTVKEACTTGCENITKETKAKVIENTMSETNAPKINHASSDLSNTCFHCKKSFDTQKSLIEHLYDILQMKRKNTEIVPVLKSVLFKCNKCDIHFTSSLLAANHPEHMEMLINWKCTICNRIFKKEDELSHERQHSVSNNFLTYNLGDLDVANILFRCSKCATHFTESNFLYHYRDCGLEATKTVTCKICNILLDYNLKTLHEFDKHTESKAFTIIQCDVISDNPVKSTVNKSQTRDNLKEILKPFREVKIVLQKMDSNKINRLTKSVPSEELPNVFQENEASSKLWRTRLRKTNNPSQKYKLLHGLNKNRPGNIADRSILRRRNLSYSYCRNCKCFITKFKKAVHLLGSCKKLAKKACTCEHCGLILNRASIMTHRRLHMERKDLKVANFRFFNLINGRTMNPPIPEYPKCTHCAVHFLTKSIRDNHICSEVAYKTCKLCEIKLSEAAFNLHVTFHQYASDRKKTIMSKNLETATTLDVAKRDAHGNVSDTTEDEKELPNNLLEVAETELTGNMSRECEMNDTTKPDASLVENKKRPVKIANHLALRRRNMIYSYCKTCKCFITKYKKDAHIQGRCKKMTKSACTCEHCGLILNDASIVTHRRLHEVKKDLKLKNFRFFNLYTGRAMNPPIPEYPKCTRCAVHFLTRKARDNHICSEVAYKTCNICEIKLSESALNLHVTFHQYASDRKKTIILKNLEAASTLEVAKRVAHENVSDTTKDEKELPNNLLEVAETELTGNMSRECEMNDKTKLDASLVKNKKRSVNIADHLALRRRNMIYSYCKTCKCFITKYKKDAHIQGRCKKMTKSACTCEHCGLILNDASIVTHRRLHEVKKDLKLKNFRFFNLYTGRAMNPPIPEYPKCTRCAVHFLTRKARDNHICSEVAYKTCNICEIKLSESALNLHVTFHQYASDRKKTIILKNLEAASTLEVAKRVAHENVSDTTKDEKELPNNLLEVAETELTGNMSRECEMNDKTKLDASLVKNKKRSVNIADHLALRRRNMIYSYCKTCKCFITKFKKSAHAQGRCKKMAKTACTCEQCGLILNDGSIVTHRRLHEVKKDLKLKNFRFFNLYTGGTMNPPIPEYPNCSHCAVHFLTKPARNDHICSEVAYKTCNICEIKLSEAAFNLHVTFHQYASDRKKTIISKNLEAASTLEVAKRVARENVSDTNEDEKELSNNLLDVAEIKSTAIRKSRNIRRKYEMSGQNAYEVVNKKRRVSIADLRRKRNLTYSYCETCKCFVTKFKNAAHVQGRCKNLGKIDCTCEYCGLILNRGSVVTHRRLHLENRDLKLNNFRFLDLYNGRSTNPHIPDYPKCDHCEVHFLTEKARNNHVCNAETDQTCHVCEIKLSEAAFKLHMTFHQYATDRINRVKSKNSNSTTTLELEKCVTDGNVTKSTESYKKTIHNQLKVAETKQTGNMSQDYKMNNKTKLDASLDENKKRPVNIADQLTLRRRNMMYSYCENCKCFITKFKKDAHIQGRCKKLAIIACTCEHCGLILNDVSIVAHRRLHEEKKDLKLKNFRFFNLYTGRSMNPPVPEYPKCTHCAVHFLTKKARNNHICSQQAYQRCHLCEMKLSQAAFKLHMNFHQYATDRINRVTSKNSQSATTLDIEKRVTNEDVTNSIENYIKPIRTPLDLAEKKLTSDTSQEYKMNDKNEQDALQVVNKETLENITDQKTLHALKRRNVTYSYCETCKCFVTKFSKATHVQGRCNILAKFACTCELCGLILSDASVVTHRRLHEERKDVKLKHFSFFNLYTGRSMNPPIPEYPKCTHCAVQFLTQTARNNHICSEQSYQMCDLCESKLSEAAFKLHTRFHQYPKDRCMGVKTMNSQSATTLDNEKQLTGENVTTTENDTELKNNLLNLAETRLTETEKCRNISRQYETYSGRKLDAFQAVNSKGLNVEYSFCETCRCFITKFKKDAHVEGRCRNMAKIASTCEQCGLVLNSASIVTHRRLHEKITDLKLKNFRFFNLYTGRSMNPPVPEYPKCTHCAVHFLTKTARKDHVCSKDAYQTCHLCEIKLTDAAFQLHMTFHQYATERIKKVAVTSDIEKPVTNKDECQTTENETELVPNPLDVAETPVQNSSEIYEIVYICGNCSVSVDTYDKVVEHCQRHFENNNQDTQTKVCNYCELTIDAACYTDHQNLHEKEKELKLLKFDSYYLPADNNMWVKHIFKTLPKEKVLDVLRSSIYKFECRMKMDVIQQGDPNLTVYKCDECNCFIEPSSLFKHSDNSCFKLRHHPCAICGIPFNSSASRIDHEKIHNRPGITMDSYRIVVFNREQDKQINRSFCLRKNYVLFQCRNCGVIIDKLQRDIHTCDVSNVKKCPQCALLLHSKDFEKHVNTHKEFVSFNYSNMKIIILGEGNPLKDQNEITLRSNFKGAIYDYKMYICNKCEICVRNDMSMSNHICHYGKQRLKCLKCDLYFSVGTLKTHTRAHEQDPDFVRSNMNLVSFDPCNLDQNKNTTTVCSKDCELSDSNTDSDTDILTANDTSIANVMEAICMTPEIPEEETVKLYKCTCELHFLNEDSIIRHFGVCRSTTTISKQRCSKCDLLFTPNVLFTHMLAHHSRKSCYKYDIIQIDHTQENMLQ